MYISNQVKDPGHPFLDEQSCNVYFISRWNLSATHKWVILLEFLSKTYIHAYCCFVLKKENSLVSNCSSPRAFPLMWLSNSSFPTCRVLPRKPGMVGSHNISYLSQAKAAKNPLKQNLNNFTHSRSSLSLSFREQIWQHIWLLSLFFLEDPNPISTRYQ